MDALDEEPHARGGHDAARRRVCDPEHARARVVPEQERQRPETGCQRRDQRRDEDGQGVDRHEPT